MKVLVIGAHPDDEILGVGGTISKHINDGDEVYICIITKAYQPEWSEEYIEQKINEQEKVDKLLNIKKRFNLDLPTVKLNTLAHGELNRKITYIIDKVNPNVVYTHFEHDLNYDHSLIFRASLVATRPPKKIKLLCYETLSETEWNNKPFIPNYWIEISKDLDKKIKAFKCYKSEVREFPHPRSIAAIKVLAMKRGSEICVQYAEAFSVIRNIWC